MRELGRRNFLKDMLYTGAAAYGLSPITLLLAAPERAESIEISGEPVCPKSSRPARSLWAVRLNQLDTVSFDQPFQNRPEEALPLACLQGLVNRKQPQIFLVFDRFDETWLNWLCERGDVDEIRWANPEELYERFLPAGTGVVITDPNLPGSINVATMLAAIHGWLPVTPRLMTAFNLRTSIDLRGRWKKNIDAYRWFYSNYGSQLSNRACAYLDPAVHELRDYFVEFKVPLIWVSGPDDTKRSLTASPAEEEEFARDLFLKLPPNIPCLGWMDHGQCGEYGIGEDPGVTLLSQYAKFEVCSGWDGWGRPVSNLSVHSGTSATFSQRVYPPPPLEKKVYFTFTRTDGDGPNFWRHVYRDLWDQPAHGTVPIGWQLGPTAHDLIPDILDYFYRHATQNDVFINSLTGIDYIHENHYAEKLLPSDRESVWNQYIEISSRYFRLLDLSLLTTFQEMRPELLDRFTRLPRLQGIFANYNRSEQTTIGDETFEVNGIPVFRTVVKDEMILATRAGCEHAVQSVVRDVQRFTPRRQPAFLEVSLNNWAVDLSVLTEIPRVLGPDYVLVRPDQLPPLYKQWKSST